MIVTLTPNPCVDKTFVVEALRPGEKHVARECSAIAGGKGVNVSRAVTILGEATQAIVLVAGTTGQEVVSMIEADGVKCAPVWTDGLTRTITTVLETAQHRQTPLFEPGPPLSLAALASLKEHVAALAPRDGVMTFNGTIPDQAAARLYATLIPMAKEAGALTVLDSHSAEFAAGIEALPDVVKPNLEELSRWAEVDLPTEALQWAAIDRLQEKGIPFVLLSRGGDSALIAAKDQRFRVTPPAIKEINPVGSGDAFLAGFCVGRQRKWPVEECLRLAAACGAANAANWEIGHFSQEEVAACQAQVRIEAL